MDLGAEISVAGVTRRLNAIETLLYAPEGWGLHAMAYGICQRPDGFSRELKAQNADQLRLAVAERWLLQQFLPMEAANDPPAIQPGAA